MHTGKGQASATVGGIVEDITDIGGGSPLAWCCSSPLASCCGFRDVSVTSPVTSTHGKVLLQVVSGLIPLTRT